MSRLARWAGLWGPVALYLALIVLVSHQPNLVPPGEAPDGPLHLIEYFILAVLVTRAAAPAGRVGLGLASSVAAACVLFGVLDEVHQSFVPGRSATSRDVLYDAAGAAAG
ncbi:MAG TPA: VanZ family protein, partial [Candidatus Polarisedimenticolia bacterium]|nr:VanZ family protein [Candidatus Polarisedimenticolia bacterium]